MVTELSLPRIIAPVPKPPSWLKGDWRFGIGEGTKAPDLSRYRNHGTINGASWSTSGRHGYCLDFDGVDYVEVADHASLNILGELTVELWVYLDNIWATGHYPVFLIKEKYDLMCYPAQDPSHPGRFRFDITDGDGNAKGAYSPKGLTAVGTWFHLVGVYNGAKALLYVNGVEYEGDATTAGIESASGYPLYFGSKGGTAWSTHDGKIEKVRILGIALSQSEITARYNAT